MYFLLSLNLPGARKPPRLPLIVKKTPTICFEDEALVLVVDDPTLPPPLSLQAMLLGAEGAVEEDSSIHSTPQPIMSPGLKAHLSLSALGCPVPEVRVHLSLSPPSPASISVSPSSHTSSSEDEESDAARKNAPLRIVTGSAEADGGLMGVFMWGRDRSYAWPL